ncbi:hypothetical protein [Bacillus sp. BML-BC060]|uniref:hypothetical protein n=1 Tax=Bacillus sp. BML-BC060 TaxID=2842487 RepID=UPI001C7F1E3A|nr:hypothetical protein [Bacillus sp. BML-BC060]
MKKVDLDAIDETNVIETKQEESFTHEVRNRFKDEVQVKKKGSRGPKAKKNGVRKSFNINQEIVKKLEEEAEEQNISASDFVENRLREYFDMKK